MFVVLIVIFAPMSFSASIFGNFIEVYEVEAAALLQTTSLISVLDVAIISGMMFATLYQNYEKFRGSLDRQQVRHDIKLESQTRQFVQVAIGAALLATFMLSIYYFTFWSSISIIQVIIFYAITILSSLIGVWLFWQKEGYIFIAMTIWIFLSDVVMIFINANDSSYSWMIICHLFLILFVVILSINRYFEKYLAQKGVYEPSWIFSLVPLFSYIAVLWKKRVRVTRGVEQELEEILDEEMKDKVKEKEPLIIDIEKIKGKGKEAIKIIQNYQKIISRIVKGEMNILSLANINSQVLDIIKENSKLHKEAILFFEEVDSILWDDYYNLKDGSKILQIAEKVYDELIKKR